METDNVARFRRHQKVLSVVKGLNAKPRFMDRTHCWKLWVRLMDVTRGWMGLTDRTTLIDYTHGRDTQIGLMDETHRLDSGMGLID